MAVARTSQFVFATSQACGTAKETCIHQVLDPQIL
jgi:hypothetical protein